VLGFEDPQKIERTEFDDPFAVAHNDALEDGGLLAQQHPPLVAEQAIGFPYRLHGGALAEIGLA